MVSFLNFPLPARSIFDPHWRSKPESKCKHTFHIYHHYEATWLVPWLHLDKLMLIDVTMLANPCVMYHSISTRGVLGVGVKSLLPGNSAVRDQSVGWFGELSTVSDPGTPKTPRSWRLQQSRARYSSLVPQFPAIRLLCSSFAQMFHAGGMQCCRFWV